MNDWIPCSERLPEENVPVNITWVNHDPPEYYESIKDVPQTATGVFFKGEWYWYTSIIEDVLVEYGRRSPYATQERIDSNVEITAWMYLPEPYKQV